jgi:nitrite reductase/ring-hydroxylating ferredoxin subunit
MSFIEVAKVNDLPPGAMKNCTVNGKEILVSNVDGKFHAIDNACTHSGGDLSHGKLEGNTVTCPWHGAKFDVTSGECVFVPKIGISRPKINNTNSYATKVEGNSIKVDI